MKAFLTGLLLLSGLVLQAQQLFLEGFGRLNRTRYSSTNVPPDIQLSSKSAYLGFGGRLGFGADHLQVGGEYRSNLTNPTFKGATDEYAFDETYYGGFIRTKISRYPAMRFGLVLRIGAGAYNTTASLKKNGFKFNQDYDAVLGLNGGLGFSIPMAKHTMLEIGYTYNYLKRPDGVFIIPAHTASYHSISAGISLNFVFGKRAEQYRHLQENWKFRNGWRG
ncbi:MAG: outer membrane beta-barrel protein [Bacteroidetes bacterium]|nr:outer membrane beta-barrel protein [Bacteroidota bacterium]